MTQKEFNKLSLQKRITLLRSEGEVIGQRTHLSYEVYLYSCTGFYVEVWIKAGLDLVQWIEVVNNEETLKMYIKDIDLNSLY